MRSFVECAKPGLGALSLKSARAYTRTNRREARMDPSPARRRLSRPLPSLSGALAAVGLAAAMFLTAAQAQDVSRLCGGIGTDDTIRPVPGSLGPAVNAVFGDEHAPGPSGPDDVLPLRVQARAGLHGGHEHTLRQGERQPEASRRGRLLPPKPKRRFHPGGCDRPRYDLRLALLGPDRDDDETDRAG